MPVWPGDPPVSIERVADGAGGYPAVSRLSLSSHTGTHVDPPAHFLPGGATVDQLSSELLVGSAWVVHVMTLGPITATMLEAADMPPGVERLLVRTSNSERADRESPAFDPGFAALSADAAKWVAAHGIRLIGIDGPSIGPFGEESMAVHLVLLSAGILPIEGLNLAGVAPGPYELICLPLLIEGGDGAPARVLLIRDA
jgi:arylformamidase